MNRSVMNRTVMNRSVMNPTVMNRRARDRRPGPGAVLAALALVAFSAGCGPKTQVKLGLRNYATNVIYGNQAKPPPPPALPGAALEPGFPSFLQAPLAAVAAPVPPAGEPATTTPHLPPPSCPVAAFSIPAAVAATPTAAAPPLPASYAYRQTGFISVAGRTSPPGAQAVREVKNPVDGHNGSFTFDVFEFQPDNSLTITSYLVDQRTGSVANDGVFITQVVSQARDGTIDQFAPATPIRILSLPADPSNPQWVSAGTDGTHNLTMSFQGSITGHGRIDACGTVLDSWAVTGTGRIVSPTKSLTFTAIYNIAPQFGGLSLSDELQMSGTDGGAAVPPESGASCTQGQGSVTVDTVTTIAQAVAQCPGFVVSRDTTATITASPKQAKP